MSYSISIIIDLKKNNNISNTENLLREIGYNCKTINIYEDYQLDGINKYIRTNYKILIFEFEMIDNIENFLELIVSFRNVKIEYIYYENSALYVSKKYLNDLSNTTSDKKKIEDTIEKNKIKREYNKIYSLLS